MIPFTNKPDKFSIEDLVSIILGAGLTVVYVGYYYGTGAHLEYLPWIYHLADPSVLARDWVISSPAYHYNVLWLIARLSQFLSLPLIFLLTHGLAALLFVAAIFWLSQSLFAKRGVFYLTLFLLLHWGLDIYGTSAVGGNALFSFQFAPHVLAVPFCILAFAFFIRGQYAWATLLAGLATNIHFLLGALTMLIIGAYLAGHWTTVARRQAALAFIGYLLVAAITLVPVMREQFGMKTEPWPPHPFTEIMGRMRAPHHYLPTTWPWPPFARFLTFLLFAAATFHTKLEADRRHRIVFITGSILALCLIGTVFVEFLTIDWITKLQFFRLLIFVKLFAFIYIADYLRNALEKGDSLEQLLALFLLLAGHYILIGALAACLLASRYGKPSRPRGPLTTAAGLVFGILLIFFAGNASDLWPPRLMDNPLLGVMAAAGLALLYGFYRYGHDQPLRRTGPALILLLITILTMDTAAAWRRDGLQYYFRYHLQATSAWEQIAEWARIHSPKQALFITPPYLGGFRVHAQRAIVIDFGIVPLWDRDLPEWKRRLEDLCGGQPLNCMFEACREPMQKGYAGLSAEAIRRLAQSYEADYFICERRERLPFERVHWNEEFDVYKLR